MDHRSEVACLPHSGVVLRCFKNLEDKPHWTALMGHVTTIAQMANAWNYHLQVESGDRDG